ncbi:MAG: CPBP family intramembrane glutamic endopeptidase [Eubacterium sp.]
MRQFHQGKTVTMGQGILAAAVCMILTCAAVPIAGLFHGAHAELIALIIRDGIALLIGALIYFRACSPSDDPSWERIYGKRKWWHAEELIVLVILVFFGFKSASSLGTLADNFLHSGQTSVLESTSAENIFLVILACVIAAPLMEEIVIRGILFRSLRMRCSFAVSAVLSSVLWAVWHGSVSQAVTAFLTGLILSLLYELYRNLWITIVVHAGNNALALYLLHMPMNTSGTHSLTSGTGLVVLACEILVAVYFYYKLLKGEPVRGRFARR